MQRPENELDIQQLRASAEAAGQLLKVLANPDRLLLLCQLSQGELNVTDLEALSGIQQPTLSQQLAVLRSRAWWKRDARESKSITESAALPRLR